MKRLALIAALLCGAAITFAQSDYDNFSTYTGQSDFGFSTANVYMFNEVTLASLTSISSVSFVAGDASSSGTLTATASMYIFNSNGTATSLGTEIGGVNFGSLGSQTHGDLYTYTGTLITPLSLASATSNEVWVGFIFNKGNEVLGSGSAPATGSATGNILYGTNVSSLTATNSASDNFAFSLTPTPSPEPVTLALAGGGLITAIVRRRHRTTK